jgi:hypothetical protein
MEECMLGLLLSEFFTQLWKNIQSQSNQPEQAAPPPVLAVFSCISLSELLKSFSMSSTIIMRYAFKSGSTFSGVLWCPGLGEVGVLGSDDGEWKDPFLIFSVIPGFPQKENQRSS